MPELPEVETTRRGIAPYAEQQTITRIITLCDKLRLPLEQTALSCLHNRRIEQIIRRGKHLILNTDNPALALHLHLGMSGALRICTEDMPYKTHDRVIIVLANSRQIRFHDPRKFGLCSVINPQALPSCLQKLGYEPLADEFDASVLYAQTRNKKTAVKTHIMNQQYIVGVGNIYATEALFYSAIHPARPAHSLSLEEAERLTKQIKRVLNTAIAQGGTTLRDFVSPEGSHGYFAQTLSVYGRAGQPCPRCSGHIAQSKIGGRSSAYCPRCQPLQ